MFGRTDELKWRIKMSSYCSSCGVEIPDGQGKSCSMCYGDIGYGSDGYYQQWADEQERQADEQERPNEENCDEVY